jgi:hypothetical protein
MRDVAWEKELQMNPFHHPNRLRHSDFVLCDRSLPWEYDHMTKFKVVLSFFRWLSFVGYPPAVRPKGAAWRGSSVTPRGFPAQNYC